MMMKELKALFVSSVLLFFSIGLFGQESPLQTIDVIYTHSGSLWRGQIVEITEDRYYVVETVSGLILRIPEDGIKSVKQQWVGRGPRAPKVYKFKEEGFYSTIELGLNGNSGGGGMNLTYSAGHRFNRWIGVGAGFGYAGYDLGWGRNTIPVFAEIRGFALKKKVSPYYAFRAGYGFAMTNELNGVTEANGGYFINPQIGVRFGGGSAVSFYTGLGVNIQKASFRESWWSEQIIEESYVFRRLELKFGITF